MTDAAPPLLVDAAEAARLLAVSPRTLWDLTDRGEVRAVRIGRSVRYAMRDLVDYVERLRQQARALDPQPSGLNGSARD